MKTNDRVTDESIPYYKKWQFYVLLVASLLSFLVVVFNILSISSSSVLGIIWWIAIATFYTSACYILMQTPTAKTRNYVILAAVLGVLFDVLGLFTIFTALFNE